MQQAHPMQRHDLILVLLALVSEILGTISGFGSSSFLVPMASSFESFHFVLALTSLLHVFGNLSKIFLFKSEMPFRKVARLAMPSILLAGVGALLATRFQADSLKVVLGILLMLMAGLNVYFRKTDRSLALGTSYFLMGGSGFFTGLVGTGGAIRAFALSSMKLSSATFVAVSASIDLFGDVARAAIYLSAGYMDWSQVFYLPLLGAAAVAGSLVGRYILKCLPQSYFENVVAGVIFLTGVSLVFG